MDTAVVVLIALVVVGIAVVLWRRPAAPLVPGELRALQEQVGRLQESVARSSGELRSQ